MSVLRGQTAVRHGHDQGPGSLDRTANGGDYAIRNSSGAACCMITEGSMGLQGGLEVQGQLCKQCHLHERVIGFKWGFARLG